MFTIKGVKQGASKLTQVSLKVLKQGGQLVGAAYGVPLAGLASKPVATVGELAGQAGELVEATAAPPWICWMRCWPSERRKALDRISALLPQRP